MKPYGVPRTKDLIYPDVADIQRLGLASHCGRIPGKSGDYRPYICGQSKARTRRIWKRKARAAGRAAIKEGFNE
jgi:hypothetical protein